MRIDSNYNNNTSFTSFKFDAGAKKMFEEILQKKNSRCMFNCKSIISEQEKNPVNINVGKVGETILAHYSRGKKFLGYDKFYEVSTVSSRVSKFLKALANGADKRYKEFTK